MFVLTCNLANVEFLVRVMRAKIEHVRALTSTQRVRTFERVHVSLGRSSLQRASCCCYNGHLSLPCIKNEQVIFHFLSVQARSWRCLIAAPFIMCEESFLCGRAKLCVTCIRDFFFIIAFLFYFVTTFFFLIC